MGKLKEAAKGVGIALAGKLAYNKVKRDVAVEVADELDRRKRGGRQLTLGDYLFLGVMFGGLAVFLAFAFIYSWYKNNA